jgi:hypothetical protein
MLQLEECFNECNNHQQQQCHEHQNFEGTRRPQRPHLNNSHLKPLTSHIHIHMLHKPSKTLDLSRFQTLNKTLNTYVMILTTTTHEQLDMPWGDELQLVLGACNKF